MICISRSPVRIRVLAVLMVNYLGKSIKLRG